MNPKSRPVMDYALCLIDSRLNEINYLNNLLKHVEADEVTTQMTLNLSSRLQVVAVMFQDIIRK